MQTINSHFCVGRYTNVYVRGLQVLDRYWSPLAAQRSVTALFPLATLRQIKERGDTTCPVCLDDMRLFAVRITPCSHIFHGQCLCKCIIQFGQCPLCKHPLWWVTHYVKTPASLMKMKQWPCLKCEVETLLAQGEYKPIFSILLTYKKHQQQFPNKFLFHPQCYV